METVLFVDACVRGEKSRTGKLARCFLDACMRAEPGREIIRRDLCRERPQPQYPEVLEHRDALWREKRWDDPVFALAREFAAADKIVLAAPFWDLTFPAVLKIYLERISVTDITFGYDEQGTCVGLCRAAKLLLITTRGGFYRGSSLEMATPVLRALCIMYGIPEFLCLDAEGLDDVRQNPQQILLEAFARAEEMARDF